MYGRGRVRSTAALAAMLVALLSLHAGLAYAASAKPAREIVVNIPEYTLYLYENGQVIGSYPVGVGQALKPSVLGPTVIINKVVDPTYYPPDWWKRGLQPIPPGPDNPVGTRWLGLGFPGYGIHGTNNPDSIGKAVSAGCIRLRNEDVEELASLVSIGTPVNLIYETVRVQWDDERGVPVIQVFPDIYNLGTTTLERVRLELEALGVWERVDVDHLRHVLAQASGVPQPIKMLAPPAPHAADMIEGYAAAIFPKRAVGLIDGRAAEVRVATLVAKDGSVAGARIAQSSGVVELDAHALRLAESAVTFRPHEHMYEIQFSVVFDASDPADRRMALRPEGNILAPPFAEFAGFDVDSAPLVASRID